MYKHVEVAPKVQLLLDELSLGVSYSLGCPKWCSNGLPVSWILCVANFNPYAYTQYNWSRLHHSTSNIRQSFHFSRRISGYWPVHMYACRCGNLPRDGLYSCCEHEGEEMILGQGREERWLFIIERNHQRLHMHISRRQQRLQNLLLQLVKALSYSSKIRTHMQLCVTCITSVCMKGFITGCRTLLCKGCRIQE